MKKILILLVSVLVILNSAVFAEEIEKTETEEIAIYQFPEIKPEFSGFIGYRLIGHSGSGKAGEFEYLHSSIAAGGQFIAFPFPHRIHLGIDFLNKKDYFGDVRYAYKDMILFRGLTRKTPHNLDNITLADRGTSSLYTVDRRDAGEKYNIAKSMSNLFLRFKTPDFPFHIYFGGNLISKDGILQQRYLTSYNTANRASSKRKVDWKSKDIIAGINSHVGPVEVDVSHSEKRLNIEGDRALENSYNGNTLPIGLMPELKGSATTIKLHTSYTDRLVAATTFTWIDRENKDSNANANYFIGSADLTYIPHTTAAFFVKYRHKETDVDNPDTIPANYLGYPAYTSPITVKPSISSKMDALSTTVRYRPINKLTLNAEYIYEKTSRENSDNWKLSKATVRNVFSLSADTRLIDKLTLRAKYTHQEVDAPAYNTQPDSSDEGKVSLAWSPVIWANGFLSYNITKEKREKLYFIDEGVQVTGKDRERWGHRLVGRITFTALKNFAITPSYAHIRNKTKQYLQYDNTGVSPPYNEDPAVIYKDIAHTYAVDFNYMPTKNLTLNADVSHTKSKGNFYPGGLLSTVTSFTESEANLRLKETVYSLGGDYEFKNGFGVGMRYKYADYDDSLNNSKDGHLHVALLTISKKW